jgi:hypothetical protein
LFAHDLIGKPLHTFPDHALEIEIDEIRRAALADGDGEHPAERDSEFPVFAAMTALGRIDTAESYFDGFFVTVLISAALLLLVDAPVSRFRKSHCTR